MHISAVAAGYYSMVVGSREAVSRLRKILWKIAGKDLTNSKDVMYGEFKLTRCGQATARNGGKMGGPE
jgi:hypothetical protein